MKLRTILIMVFITSISYYSKTLSQESIPGKSGITEVPDSSVAKQAAIHEQIKAGMLLLRTPYELDDDSQGQMKAVLRYYFWLEDAMFNKNADDIALAAGLMKCKTKNVSEKNIWGKGYTAWDNHKESLLKNLNLILEEKPITEQQAYFNKISETIYCMIKNFNIIDTKAYAAFCPIALKNKGAIWVGNGRLLRNPYLGNKMPDCGEIIELFK